jgi:hypothetical protein
MNKNRYQVRQEPNETDADYIARIKSLENLAFDKNIFKDRAAKRENCRYGEAQAAAASWRAHDGRRQRGMACPHLYRYRLTHTYCSLSRLPPTHPFVGAPILQRHFQVQWRARLHARRMDGFCNQNADQLGSLAGQSLLTVYVGVVECAPASLSPTSSSLTHARRMDGFCNQNADQFGSLAGPSLLTVYVGVVECAPASLSPTSSSLTHARRMDGFCNQNANQLGYLAGQSLLTVYVGVVECAPASPYTYSSSTHRFPDERTPIEATPLSSTSAELGLGLGLGLGLDSLSHSSSHALPFFSPPSFHTLSLSPAFTSVWWSG